MEQIGNFLNISPENLDKLTITLAIAFGLTILRILIMMVVKRRVTDPKQFYYSRRTTLYLYTFFLIILDLVVESTIHLTHDAEKQIKKAAEKYMVFYGKLTPIVYTTVRDNGVLLTARYIVDPRNRRVTEQTIWEDILLAFNKEKDINLAYPTTRFYTETQS